MAKHHWNWTKKAVLASLMLGASVLVTSTSQAVEVPEDRFDKDAFNLIFLGKKSKNISLTEGEERDKISEEVENTLKHLETKDFLLLIKGMFYDGEEQDILKNPEERFLWKEVKDSGLYRMPVRQPNGSYNFDSKRFENLTFEELIRRAEKYQPTIENWRFSDTEAKQIQQNLAEQNKTYAEAMVTNHQELSKAKSEKDRLQKELSSAEKEGEKLQAKSDELTTQLKDSQQNNKELQAQMKDLEAQSQKTSADLKASQEKVNALNKQISDSTSQNQNLQASLEQEKKNLNDLQQRFDAATKANTEDKAKLQSDLDAKQAEVNQLQAKVDESKATLDKLTAEKAEADTKVAELTAQKAEIEAKLNSQTELSAEEKAKLEKQLADIQSKIAEKDASIKSLEGQLDTLKRQEHDTTPSTPEAPQVPEVKPEDKPAEPQQPETKPQAPQVPETDKSSTPKKPEIKPAPAVPEVNPSTPHTPEKPGKGKPAAPKANHSKAHHATTPASPHMATQNTAAHLPQTGETTVNPFFSVAALSIIASAGVLATKRKED
ncbi:LPXTG cell wall anchor domain-containing protein [Streptococcus halichoeri]|uniref:LPXTG cell wall anchor domain-containing protein n=1 Tax=Streptococcus halichoeri TaxID=254785 RepID=UPI00135B7E5F|nr:LPXTG cell wall anchor domain-containing protein [Streptococcus halichoeri]